MTHEHTTGFTTTMQASRGFTLIELLVVFSLTVALSTVGIAAFVNYSRVQTVQSATYELATVLEVAKSKSQSQVNMDEGGTKLCGSKTLTGYEVRLCNAGGPICINQKGDDYELNIICRSGTETVENNLDSKKLPADVAFDKTKTTTIPFLFYPQTGGASGGKVVLVGYKNTTLSRYVFIDQGGNISISSTDRRGIN